MALLSSFSMSWRHQGRLSATTPMTWGAQRNEYLSCSRSLWRGSSPATRSSLNQAAMPCMPGCGLAANSRSSKWKALPPMATLTRAVIRVASRIR
ncbi:hypothetical protein D3C78_1186250 [compost metagenome]